MAVDLVVIGLGYVGLPLAQAATRAGLAVVGLDLSAAVVQSLNAGRSHIDDLSDGDIAEMVGRGFRASRDESVLADADTAVICVPTPLNNHGAPNLMAVKAAGRTIARHLHEDMLVVLESTTYPGTTDEILRGILEESGLVAGRDFHLVFSPERIDPGNPVYGLSNTPKIVGGLTPACTQAGLAFYGKFIETVVAAKGTREAEMAKLLENTYRHVNIALVNEMAIFCHELDIDLWDAIECASTKPFGFTAFYPGPGVGGHCIPIDPNYLSYKVRTLGYPFRFVELAQEINARMPAYVVHRTQSLLNDAGKAIHGSNVLLLGVTYKRNISDQRESPAHPVARRLLDFGADLSYHDPYVDEWVVADRSVRRAPDLLPALEAADLAILLQDHDCYAGDALAPARVVLDCRGRAAGDNVVRL